MVKKRNLQKTFSYGHVNRDKNEPKKQSSRLKKISNLLSEKSSDKKQKSSFSRIEKRIIDGEEKEVEYKTAKYFTKAGKPKEIPNNEDRSYKRWLKKQTKIKEDTENAVKNLKNNTLKYFNTLSKRINRIDKEYNELKKLKNKKSKSYKEKEKKILKRMNKTLEDSKGVEKSLKEIKNIKENRYIVKKIIANNGKTYYVKARTESGIKDVIDKIIATQVEKYGKDQVIKSYRIVKVSTQEYQTYFIIPEAKEHVNKMGYDARTGAKLKTYKK